ncbi:MAG: metallophosphoesterase, partial [Thermodesulfobacteria bacterium]|nr:metallophosphoesterase [Thermodesulfobacteriota bacterium]
ELFGPPYFSFRVRGACFVVLNNARKRRIDPVQKSWLARQLTNRDCAAKLVFMHMPIIDPRWGPDLYQQGALDLLDLLKRYGVSYVFFGHVHGFFSGRWGNVPYAVTGGAGAKLYGEDPEHFFFHYLKVTLGPDGKVAVQVERVEPVFSGFWNRFHYLCGEVLAFVRSHFYLFASLLLGAFLLLFFRLRG